MQAWRKEMNAALGAARAAQAAGDYNAAIAYANKAATAAKTSAAATAATNLRQTIYEQAGPGAGPGATMGGDGSGAQGNGQGNGNGTGGGGGRTVVGYRTRYDYGGVVIQEVGYSDGKWEELSRSLDRSAEDEAKALFTAAGLDEKFTNQLMDAINGVYAANQKPTQAQVLSAIYNSQAYKDRFKGNEAIRQRIAKGESRPGDRLLTPREYIDLEDQYRTVMQSAGMPTGFYDSPDDFANLISNGVSVAEVTNRVETAKDALTKADDATKAALKDYYGLETGDLVAYLLDPTKATPILNGRQLKAGAFGMNDQNELKTAYDIAKVGGAAGRQGLGAEYDLSKEIVDSGRASQADAAFADASRDNADVQRLGRLYGSSMDYRDLVRESLDLAGGGEAARKKRKLASKERAAFGGQSAVTETSLRRSNDV